MVLRVRKPAPYFRCNAVINGEIEEISSNDYKGRYLVLLFYPMDFTYVCPTEILAFSDRAQEFQAIGCDVLGVSTDSEFTHIAWMQTSREDGGLGNNLKIVLLSDKSMRISREYGVLDRESGLAFRGLYIIDPNGIIRHITMNDLQVGRSVEETIRLVQAFQYSDQSGEICPIEWRPGDPGLKPDNNPFRRYFEGDLRRSRSIQLTKDDQISPNQQRNGKDISKKRKSKHHVEYKVEDSSDSNNNDCLLPELLVQDGHKRLIDLQMFDPSKMPLHGHDHNFNGTKLTKTENIAVLDSSGTRNNYQNDKVYFLSSARGVILDPSELTFREIEQSKDITADNKHQIIKAKPGSSNNDKQGVQQTQTEIDSRGYMQNLIAATTKVGRVISDLLLNSGHLRDPRVEISSTLTNTHLDSNQRNSVNIGNNISREEEYTHQFAQPGFSRNLNLEGAINPYGRDSYKSWRKFYLQNVDDKLDWNQPAYSEKYNRDLKLQKQEVFNNNQPRSEYIESPYYPNSIRYGSAFSQNRDKEEVYLTPYGRKYNPDYSFRNEDNSSRNIEDPPNKTDSNDLSSEARWRSICNKYSINPQSKMLEENLRKYGFTEDYNLYQAIPDKTTTGKAIQTVDSESASQRNSSFCPTKSKVSKDVHLQGFNCQKYCEVAQVVRSDTTRTQIPQIRKSKLVENREKNDNNLNVIIEEGIKTYNRKNIWES